MSEKPREEATAQARAAARVARDLFIAMTAEGFTEGQALVILGQMIANAGRGKEDG